MFAAAAGAVLVGLVFWETLHILMALFCLPLFGLQCDELTKWVFGFKRVNGRLRKADQKFAPFVRYVPAVNENARREVDIDKAHLGFMLFRIAVKIALIVPLVIWTLPDWRMFELSDWPMDKTFRIFLCIISFGALLNDIIMLITISMHRVSSLGGYVQQIGASLKKGADITSLDLRPLDELELPDEPSEADTLAYLYYYSVSLIMRGDEQKLREPMHKMTDMLRSGEFTANCVNSYGLLIYYYSWLEPDEEYARKFYDKAGTALATDPGAGSKRALAYYTYAVLHDPNKARYYLERARRTANETENRLEPLLIGELDEILKSEGF
jgi:hypothetical protein